MKKIMLTLALCTVIAAGAVAPDRDWADYSRYAAANAALTQAPEVVFMGNSITDGWDDADPSFFTDNNYACRGIAGQVTAQMLCRFRDEVINLKPKAVVILAGVNDIAKNNGTVTLEHILGNIVSMAELARVHGIEPILCSPTPVDYFYWRPEVGDPREDVKELRDMIKSYARQQGITYVDYYSALAMDDDSMNPAYTADRIHPNAAGYAIMEPIIQSAISHTLNK